MSGLTVEVWNVWTPKKTKSLIRFDNVRDERTILVDKAVTIGRSTYAKRKDGRLVIFGMSMSSRHFRAGDRGALNYIEAAWRLGVIPKVTYDRYAAIVKEKQAKEHIEQAAANAIDYTRAAGVELPEATLRELKKKADRL